VAHTSLQPDPPVTDASRRWQNPTRAVSTREGNKAASDPRYRRHNNHPGQQRMENIQGRSLNYAPSLRTYRRNSEESMNHCLSWKFEPRRWSRSDKAQQQHQTATMSGRILSTETEIAALKSEMSSRLEGLEGTIQQATTSIEEICSAMVQRVEESSLSGIRQLEDSISSLRSSVSSLTSNTNPSHESILAPALE